MDHNMDKIALVAHLANITFIMDYHQRLGTTVNPLIAVEFTEQEKVLHGILKQEQEDEARSRSEPIRKSEDRTEVPSDLAGRG